MKTALVHDWLITQGGSEKVLEVLSHMFPSSPIYTLFYDEKKMSSTCFAQKEVFTSFLQNIPGSLLFYRYLLPLFPKAIQTLDVAAFDCILSSSHAVAKGIKVREDQLHICYCHTPMRYIWDLQEEYLSSFSLPMKKMLRHLFCKMRSWDVKTSQNVDLFIANSKYVAKRIERAYQRKAMILYPPVSTQDFFLSSKKEEYYVTHARLVPYKRIDLLVEAFSYMPDKKLVIIGTGPEEKKLKAIATANVEFLGFVDKKRLAIILSLAKAYLFAAEEDFGMGIVEAQSSGLPVIALKKGGALETILEGKTGLFFEEPTLQLLMQAIKVFEQKQQTFDPHFIKSHAEQFNQERFWQQCEHLMKETKKGFYENRHLCRRERNASLASFSKQLS